RREIPAARWQPLFTHGPDARAYGATLTGVLFSPPDIRERFNLAFATTMSSGADASLRLRLFIDPGSPELHGLAWETLQHPEQHGPNGSAAVSAGETLASIPQVYFSRFLSSSDSDWRTIRLRARGDLRALGAVASPTDLSGWNLGPINAIEVLDQAGDA